jgi:hypothetical protein
MLNCLNDRELKDLIGVRLADHVSEFLHESSDIPEMAMETY